MRAGGIAFIFSCSSLAHHRPNPNKSLFSSSSFSSSSSSFISTCRNPNFSNPIRRNPPLKRSISATVMASAAYKPEEARLPPALPLPPPPISKASSQISLSSPFLHSILDSGAISMSFPCLNLKMPFFFFSCCCCCCFFQFKIALCQLSVTADKERNIAHARKAIEEAAEKGAQLVLLPEIWNSPYSNDSFPVYAEDIDAGGDASPSSSMLSEVASRLRITIVGGSIPERSGDRLYNTCCVFGKDGKLKAKHRKIHLFDIDIPGKITFKESKTLTAGETPTIVDTDVGRIGIGICYDIRFQELAMLYGARGAHLLCYPGAFNMTTGPLHWELLQRARAADNQLYVATCSPARDAGAGYIAWGHSTLIGPFGEVLATTEHDEAIVIAEIDYSVIELRRTSLPIVQQRRGDLYQLVDIQRLKAESH
ncbi:nitrilase/cyanide hydratase and apolipoprotein N-acyltransferase family protein [Cinnamomum micranthum f. kanehirae]|uniref:Nitrilase/cyanide hydratase and apolipoprotein N-acyltransferase family protein n=2 Tax=Magnoliopsida TaxID=3398 RepID=A0A3S3PQY1_9MAGN|nr:nitrilase/cyanide hydratase and apolipoprotein N-acyltransferase family protein [Cinnamomum micranthum f. kanehirae]